MDAVDQMFNPPPPKQFQLPHYDALKQAGADFVRAILENTPPNDDQQIAIQKAREAVMFANVSIALDVDPFEDDTFLAWDNPRTDSPCRAFRVIGVKCVDLSREAWQCWKDGLDDGSTIEEVQARLQALGLDVEIVDAGDDVDESGEAA